ncbi:hypothetical protein [Niabella beijingensis]|uniref:hypothetical protein n=1 Tax=Niabella beijingensis TaxID=2872700 RepID=UPI001CBD3E06|nr:hypothetical protein [Niabella beijingensis]MBZ4188077.1 hypothetical protein [Niabella beijingensis]
MRKVFLSQMVLSLAMVIASNCALAQTSLKFRNGGGPSGSGPNTASKVVAFNYGNTANAYNPALNVTYSLSNQQYSSIEGNSNIPGLVFGGNGNSNANTPAAQTFYNRLNAFGLATNASFSTNGVPPGIDVANDYAVALAAIADALINANGSNRVAMGTKNIRFADLTLTFNRPVNNPILHLENMGGWWSTSNNGVTGYSVWLRLLSAGYTLSRLSGNTPFVVPNNTDIKNAVAASANGAIDNNDEIGQGSVQVNGNGITSLVFRVFLDGDANNGARWSTTNTVQTDLFTVGVSMAAYNVSGNVLNDANGLTDNTVNGTGTNAGGLNAVLIDPVTNVVIATVPVNPDGTYSFSNIASGNYSIQITTASATVNAPPPAVELPDGWVATGEHLGSGAGSDGTPDGILTGVTLNSNLSDANFGIERTPVSDDKEQTIPLPENNSIPQGAITAAVSGSDAEDGTLGNSNTIVITSLPANGTLYYNGNPVTAGQTITDFDPSLLSFTDLQDGTDQTSFGYSFVDAAGKQSQTPGTYTVKWEGFLPVTFGPITAKFTDGVLVVDWSTLMENNNDHFEIELSKDAVHFTAIGSVASKAVNGISGNELQYHFTKPVNSLQELAGLFVLAAGLLLGCFNSRTKVLLTILLITGAGILPVSCNKKETQAIDHNSRVYVRIVQIDKDGKSAVSKTVTVTPEP